MRVLICAPDIFSGDAVGNHCLGVARAARRLGFAAELYAQNHDAANERVHPLSELTSAVQPDDVLFLSYSIFDPNLDQITKLKCKKIGYFHGVTDPELLRAFEPRTAQLCQDALAQLPALEAFDLLVANSHFSAQALEGVAGHASIEVVPPVFADMPAFSRNPNSRSAPRANAELLMVGRVVPHKRIEDGIEILHRLRNLGVPSTLSVIGSMPNYDYSKYLINYARRLGVLDNVDFKGTLDDCDLLDCFERSAVLLVTSRHEGFCVPVLEAMHYGKPVLVRAGTAAEELCLAESVLPDDAPADSWATLLAQLVDVTGGKAGQSREIYLNRAKDILLKTSDEVWRNLFTQLATGRTT
ncbi:glycosyltransferase family 4 protein [Paraburkholderia nemoris]|uniref:glycosyltransferase family 4 protein n=1 Tax=Paraburkholderia nemoris TaxID=2793076 RepID=UPI001B11DEDE|nr:glycosyltransferase [Paraburkholderia nemoris]CAE6706866.1 hypothetical protein LMG22931_01070 [Paraburkholderia nemoris]